MIFIMPVDKHNPKNEFNSIESFVENPPKIIWDQYKKLSPKKGTNKNVNNSMKTHWEFIQKIYTFFHIYCQQWSNQIPISIKSKCKYKY